MFLRHTVRVCTLTGPSSLPCESQRPFTAAGVFVRADKMSRCDNLLTHTVGQMHGLIRTWGTFAPARLSSASTPFHSCIREDFPIGKGPQNDLKRVQCEEQKESCDFLGTFFWHTRQVLHYKAWTRQAEETAGKNGAWSDNILCLDGVCQ